MLCLANANPAELVMVIERDNHFQICGPTTSMGLPSSVERGQGTSAQGPGNLLGPNHVYKDFFAFPIPNNIRTRNLCPTVLLVLYYLFVMTSVASLSPNVQ